MLRWVPLRVCAVSRVGWVGGWEFCLETSLAHGSLVSTAFGDLRFFIYFATYSSMSDVVIHLPLVC